MNVCVGWLLMRWHSLGIWYRLSRDPFGENVVVCLRLYTWFAFSKSRRFMWLVICQPDFTAVYPSTEWKMRKSEIHRKTCTVVPTFFWPGNIGPSSLVVWIEVKKCSICKVNGLRCQMVSQVGFSCTDRKRIPVLCTWKKKRSYVRACLKSIW